MRDPETGNSKGHAFINFASFEASDAAIEAMNGKSNIIIDLTVGIVHLKIIIEYYVNQK